ncbi:Pyruvate kinase PKLR [Thelohanellus kitauei]|uniref:Pyruvate kinase n=1 Tax=Thelohanellus kitauei TaxID=669202 RepID=A0A0C2N364_THEKT|nr:Pyruvate kinase PKLR [Thelohanellus kitauei]
MTGMNQKNEPITLVKGQKVILTTDDEYKENCTSEHLYVNFPSLLQSVNAGEPIYLDDGRVKLIIEQLRKCEAICEVVYGGTFGSFKNVRLLRFPTDLPSLSEKDISDISFSAQENFDAVIAFIRNENNIKELRNVLEKIDQGKHMKIISKIANHEGVENINKILEASDAILVCKNSLGLEIGPERAVIAQKKILSVCKLRGKPVICCVQISEKSIHENLDSSIEAEVVMSNLLDGADCLMLFDDNSQCHTPVQALKKLKLFVEAAETIYRTGLHFENIKKAMFLITPEQISALSAVEISYSLKANAIIVLTTTGRTAELVSTFKPRCLIFAVTRSQRVCRSLHLYRSVCPIIYNYQPVEPWIEDIKARFTYAIRYLVEYGVLRIGSHVVLLTGWKPGPGFSNTLRAGTVNDEFSIASLCEQSNHNL